MKPISAFDSPTVRFLFTGIDDTLTDHGRLGPAAYEALWNLDAHGIKVIPVTGRPAGWCEMIARLWPVHGVVGENGGFAFRFDGQKMRRQFARAPEKRVADRRALRDIRREVLAE